MARTLSPYLNWPPNKIIIKQHIDSQKPPSLFGRFYETKNYYIFDFLHATFSRIRKFFWKSKHSLAMTLLCTKR